MKNFKSLLFSSFVLMVGCGGGNGDTNNTTQPNGDTGNTTQPQETIKTQEEARAIVAGFFGVLDFGESIRDTGDVMIQMNRDKGFGFHKKLLDIYKYTANRNSLTVLQSNQEYKCPEGGNYTIQEIGNLSYEITFRNCISLGTTIEGVFIISAIDENNNENPEELTFTLKQGFSIESTDSAFKANGDFTLSMKGFNNGDLFDSSGNIKGDLTYQGGPIRIEDKEENKWEEIKFNSFLVKLDEANGTVSFSGELTYKDNFCKTNPVSLYFNTPQEFKHSYVAFCPYAGKLSINNGLITIEAYDPDKNPETENYMKVYFNNTEIFNDICTKFSPPQSCGGG